MALSSATDKGLAVVLDPDPPPAVVTGTDLLGLVGGVASFHDPGKLPGADG